MRPRWASTPSTRQRLPLRTWSIAITAAVLCAGFDGQGGVVVAADDDDRRRGPADRGPPRTLGASGSVNRSWRRWLMASAISHVSHRIATSLPSARACDVGGEWRRRPWRSGPRCAARSWLRYQPTALRSRLPRADRSASEASRSSGSRIRHTSARRCDHGKLLAEVLEHAAAGLDRRELVGVADEDHLGARGQCRPRQQASSARGCRPWRLRRRRSRCAGPS